MALTPPLGWSTWYTYACNINEQKVKSQADAMVSSGMSAAGYQYINIDDCWQGGRDSNGAVFPDANKFPSGMKALADYVHNKGLKLGIYTDRGTATCAGYVGSQGHEIQDANTYAAWGIDFIKDDNCNSSLDAKTQYLTMRDAIQQSGRPMLFSLSTFEGGAASYGPYTANAWRTGGDVASWDGDTLNVSWSNVLSSIDENALYPGVNAPNGWNDPDNLMIGKNLNNTEDQSIFSMWSIMAAPLIYGSDMTTLSQQTKNIVTNSEVIAIDQDPQGIQGKVVWQSGDLQVWAKQLHGSGAWALVLFNRSNSAANITANWNTIGLTGDVSVRDIWAHADLGTVQTVYTANVPAHGTVMLKVAGTPVSTPLSTSAYYKITSRSSGKVLEVNNNSTVDGGTVDQWTDVNQTNEQWQLIDTGYGYYKIVSRSSGKTLEVNSWSVDNGGRTDQWTDLGQNNEQWSLVRV